MQSRSRLPLNLLIGGCLMTSPASGQIAAQAKSGVRQTAPATTARPIQIPVRPATGDRKVEAGRLLDHASTQVLARPIADCAARPTVLGEMLAGRKTTLRFADDSGGRGPPVAVVNGEPVYKPDLAAANRPKPLMPRLQKISITYRKVMVSTASDTMRNGWMSPAEVTTSLGTIIRDNRDGTADVILPDAPDAIFAQQAKLSVVTDRCTIEAPLTIRPPTHIGRWFPPALVARCMQRPGANTDVFGSREIGPTYRLEQAVQSRRPIANQFQPNSLYHNCGPYGAIHEGGSDEGAGSGTGVDTYVFWDGGFDAAFSVSEATDRKTESCVVNVQRIRHADGGGYIGTPAAGSTVAVHASRSVLEVQVTWRIVAPHGYCWYALVAKGRHPVSLNESWNTRFSRNHLGLESSMIHSSQKTDLLWAKDVGEGRRQPESATATF